MKEYTIIKPDPALQENLMAFGFMCGEGWYPIIFDTLDKIQEIVDREGLDIQITEVKEKWGGLRIYIDGYTDEIEVLIEQAEEKSVSICEICGKDGKLMRVNGWWKTRCNDCLEKEKEQERKRTNRRE